MYCNILLSLLLSSALDSCLYCTMGKKEAGKAAGGNDDLPWTRVVGWFRKGPWGCTQLNLWSAPSSMSFDFEDVQEKLAKAAPAQKAPKKKAMKKAMKCKKAAKAAPAKEAPKKKAMKKAMKCKKAK